jgi:hypothetical protein
LTAIAVSAALLFAGATVAQAAGEPAVTKTQKQTQAREQEQTHKQAIESVKKRLKENPRDEGLSRAGQCLERSAQCQDMHGLDQAMESVRHNMEKHPDDKGLHHAMEHLEKHHRMLEEKHMERERPMHQDDSGRPEKSERHDGAGAEGSHR